MVLSAVNNRLGNKIGQSPTPKRGEVKKWVEKIRLKERMTDVILDEPGKTLEKLT